MPEERPRSITSSPHLVPDDVARHTFGSVRRGFDPDEVRAYLESLAVGLRGIAEREDELLREIADAEHRAANPVLDDAALTSALGTETARVLRSAHEASAEIVAKAEGEANRMLTEVEAEVEQRRSDTESRLAQQRAAAEALAKELLEKADQQATAELEHARDGSENMLNETRERCRAMVEEAQGLRARVLADLSKRRKVLHAQIEQLRAGRERLAETVQGVRRSIDTIAEDLFAAEDNARLAAEEAGRQVAERDDEGTPEEVAASLLAEEAASLAEEVALVEEVAEELAALEEHPEAAAGAEPVEDQSAVSATGEAAETAEAAEEPGGGHEPRAGGEDAVPEASVDALFAKLRAAHNEPGAESSGDDGVAGDEVGATADVADAADDESVEDEDEDGDQPPEARDPAAIRRDELIGPIVTSLSRRLKRTLQDSQNELLDNLRSGGFHWSVDLLPDETEHLDAYATAAVPALEEAADAGVSFTGIDGAKRPSTDELIGIAHELAEAIVGPLRRRLSDEESGLAGAEEGVVSEHVGSAFREWKGERIERLAGDHVVAAFSAGTVAALAETDVELEWVAVAGFGDAPCPDCEDNGLSGPQPPGREFPTGHQHPPAHPGCRCLLTRSTT